MASYRSFFLGVTLLVSTVFSSQSFAVLLEYEQVGQSGNRFEYVYSLTNTGPVAVDAFSIFFSADSFQNLQITSSPSGWDPLTIEPDPFFGDGYADWATWTDPIAQGDTLSGFTLAFDWIGAGSLADVDYAFEVYDLLTFDLVTEGVAVAATPAAVSEPETLFFFALGLLGLLVSRTGRSMAK